MKKIKKYLSILLALSMILSLFVGVDTITVSAAEQTQAFNKPVTLSEIKTTNNMERGSHIYSTATVENDVLTVTVPAEEHKNLVSSYQGSAYLTAIPNGNKSLQSVSGYTRAIWVKYKVTSIGEGGYGQVGIGYTSTYSGSWSATNIVGSGQKITEAGDKEYSFAASIPYNGNQEYRLVFAGEGGVTYQITSITYASKQSLKYGVIRYHIGDDFIYPVFGYDMAPITSGFSALGAPKDNVIGWQNASGNFLAGNIIKPSSNLTTSADIDVYEVLPKSVTLSEIKTTNNMERGSHIYSTATVENDVLTVTVPADEHKNLVSSYQGSAYLTAIPNGKKGLQSVSGTTVAIWVKYKVTSIGEGGYGQVGIGYTSTYSGGWTATNIVGSGQKITEAGDKEYSFAASIPYNGDQEYRLVFAGEGGVTYQITSIEFVSVSSLKYGMVRYNFGDSYVHSEFGNNVPVKTTGFSEFGASKNSVLGWTDSEGNSITGSLITPSEDLTGPSDVDLYEVLPKTLVDYDFEDDSYKTVSPNCNPEQWSIIYDEETQNSYLQRASGNSNNITWGFMFPKTELVAGRIYRVSFKAKANKNTNLDYGVLTAKDYWTFNADSEVFNTDHNKVTLKADEWTNIESYFTAKSLASGSNACFRILTKVYNDTVFSFDDIIIEEVPGMSFCEYDNKYAAPHIINLDGETLTVLNDPEREGYIFDGWYVDGNPVSIGTEIAGFEMATAKWEEAVTTKEDIAEITTVGIHDLGIKVTNANAYPIKFSLNTDGKVIISIFTASANNAEVSKSIVWTRTFKSGGDIGALIEPATIKVDGVVGNELYIAIETADNVAVSISEFVIGNAPTKRVIQGDANGDNEFDIRDLVVLKKMSVGTRDLTWLGDIDGNGYIADAADSVKMRRWLLDVSDVVKTIGDRTLVWNEEFDGDTLDTEKFGYSWYGDRTNSTSSENINVSDGKLNLNVTKTNGKDFATAPRVVTDGKMSFNKGYLEVRAKLSCSPAQWASIWLGGETEGTKSGEIDIIETKENVNGLKPNIHSWSNETGERLADYAGNINLYNYDDNNFNMTEYHTFGFAWDDNLLQFYIDGNKYLELNINTIERTDYGFLNYPYYGIFDQFYSLRLSQTYYDSLTYDMVMPEYSIDYIRLYQKDGEQLKINGEIVN